MTLLVCGGSGFIGSHFIKYLLKKHSNINIQIVNFDKLTYAGNPDNIGNSIENDKRYTFVQGNISHYDRLKEILQKYKVTHIVNFAAETHVDRSIFSDCVEFAETNVLGVLNILNLVKELQIKKFIQVSTDEVYGSLTLEDTHTFTEKSPFKPNMPYAATKAGGDLLCRSYAKVHNVPVIVTHASNTYGSYQYPEKLIPVFVFRLLKNRSIFIHGDGRNIRDWLHVLDHVSALDLLLQSDICEGVYNIGADNERTNLEVALLILKIMQKPERLIRFVPDRPGNDRRYAINAGKISALGWQPHFPKEKFEEGLTETIQWYLDNETWVKRSWENHEKAYQINHTLLYEKKKAGVLFSEEL